MTFLRSKNRSRRRTTCSIETLVQMFGRADISSRFLLALVNRVDIVCDLIDHATVFFDSSLTFAYLVVLWWQMRKSRFDICHWTTFFCTRVQCDLLFSNQTDFGIASLILKWTTILVGKCRYSAELFLGVLSIAVVSYLNETFWVFNRFGNRLLQLLSVGYTLHQLNLLLLLALPGRSRLNLDLRGSRLQKFGHSRPFFLQVDHWNLVAFLFPFTNFRLGFRNFVLLNFRSLV